MGIVLGVLAIIITLPIVFNATIYLDAIYTLFHFEHPTEHELLNALASTGTPFLQFAIVVGAALVAPLWEEVAFRGHLQTLLSAGLMRMFGPRPVLTSPVVARQGFPVEASGVEAGAVLSPTPEMEPSEDVNEIGRVATPPAVRWIAVILTSLLFTSVHEMWTWPPIFILSVCLGFAYERTGNLWTSIVVHFAFNSISTTIFLASR